MTQRSTDNQTGTPLAEFQANFEYFTHQQRFPGWDRCINCERQFTADNPCWNSYASYSDGTHNYGTCRICSERVKDG